MQSYTRASCSSSWSSSMASSGGWIRPAKNCPSPFADMGFSQQYVKGVNSVEGAFWKHVKLGFIYQAFYTALLIGNAPISGLTVGLNYTVKYLLDENF